MKPRKLVASAGLVIALLALLLTAFAAVALGQESPTPTPSASVSAAPEGTPEVTGTIPNPNDPRGKTTWNGFQVFVIFRPNGAELDYEKCTLLIDGVEAELTQPPDLQPAQSPYQSTVLFSLAQEKGEGKYEFRAVLVTTDGLTVEYPWTFDSTGSANSDKLINFQVMREWFWFIARGAIITVELTVVSIFFASILALFGALGRLSKTMSFRQGWDRYQSYGYMARMVVGRIPYWVATFYTSLFRGTPLLLQIIAIYYVTPEIVNAIGLRDVVPPSWMQSIGWGDTYNPPPIICGIAALSLNYGAYLTEVFRAGIQAVPKGQNEAAWAIGLSPWKTQRRIVLPQAFKIVIPAVGNDFIALIKDTSLVSVITVRELLQRAQQAGAATFSFMSTLLVAAAFYWALTIFFSFWQAKLESRMARDKAREKERR
jgi:polar amino acid transport system permease protein